MLKYAKICQKTIYAKNLNNINTFNANMQFCLKYSNVLFCRKYANMEIFMYEKICKNMQTKQTKQAFLEYYYFSCTYMIYANMKNICKNRQNKQNMHKSQEFILELMQI